MQNSITETQLMTRKEAEDWELEVSKSVSSLRILLSSGYEREAWRALGYSDWTKCLQELADKYGFSERHAWRLHQANEISRNLLTLGSVEEIPERHLRPLTVLPPEIQGKAWQKVLETAPNGKVTFHHVQDVVDNMIRDYRHETAPHVSHNSGENEWYTPIEYIARARIVMGNIDLDPASSEIANKTVEAKKFYSKENNGLTKRWLGRVWMNPPYASDLISKFVSKYVEHVKSGEITEGIVLVNNATETNWFKELAGVSKAIVFPKGRVRFLDPNGNPGAPLQGQAVIYTGENMDTFIREFSDFGWATVIC